MTIDDVKLMCFSWIEEGRLAACRGPRTGRDLSFLVGEGIRAIVRLAYESETGMTAAMIAAAGLRDWYDPVVDYTAPSQDILIRTTEFIGECFANGQPVAVSCNAGYGRTGTVLACVLVKNGMSADQAVETLISRRPVAKEMLGVPGQVDAIREFARRVTTSD
jgi:atypical dual specificity phosphatase